MTELDAQIRSNTDLQAAPIDLAEITARSHVAVPSRSRWPVSVAAGLVTVIGAAALAVLITDQDSAAPVGEPADPPDTASVDAPVADITVEIPSGLQVHEIGEVLAETLDGFDPAAFVAAADLAAAESFLTPVGVESAEGLLAPGSYQFAPSAEETDVAAEMIERTMTQLAELNAESRSNARGLTSYEALIVASLIESEAQVASDQPLISRVIHNRLERTSLDPSNPFPLQIDATVIYGRDQAGIDPATPWPELRSEPSAWNTYLLPGLPATPITNPSSAALDAALDPAPDPLPDDPLCRELSDHEPCNLLFYVTTDESGAKAFAVTVMQHRSNVDRAAELGLLPPHLEPPTNTTTPTTAGRTSTDHPATQTEPATSEQTATDSTPVTAVEEPSTPSAGSEVDLESPVRAVSEPGPNPIIVHQPGEFDIINPLDEFGAQDWSQVGNQIRDALPNRPFPVIQTEPIDIYEPGTYILTGQAPGTGTTIDGVSLPPEVAVSLEYSIDMPNAQVTRTGDLIQVAVPLVVTEVTWPVRNVTAWLQ